jgi:hypothetical protein
MVSTPCARLPHMPLEEQQWRLLHNPPCSRGRSEHGVFSSEECGIPAPMQRWGDQWEEEVGKACQRWVVTRDAAGRCAHESGNIAVVARTLVSMLHSQGDRTLLTGLALGVIASYVALQRTVSRECSSRPQPRLGKLLGANAITPSGSPNRSITWATKTLINGR